MRNSILFGFILSVFLFLMIPHVNAIEYQEVIELVDNQYQKGILTMNSYLTENFITELIDFLIIIIGFICGIIEKVLAFLGNIVLLGGHRDPDDCPVYNVLYLLYLINLFIGKTLIDILNFISSLIDDSFVRKIHD